MGIKMGGYTCDKCNVIVIEPMDGRGIYRAVQNLLQNTNLTLRIYCPSCGKIKEYAEHTMLLKDVGDVHETRQDIHENNNEHF